MDRFDESFHSCPDPTNFDSKYLCSMDRTRPVLISFLHYCGTKFTNRTDGVDSTVLDNPLFFFHKSLNGEGIVARSPDVYNRAQWVPLGEV